MEWPLFEINRQIKMKAMPQIGENKGRIDRQTHFVASAAITYSDSSSPTRLALREAVNALKKTTRP